MIGNSVFQAMLCGVMFVQASLPLVPCSDADATLCRWGLDRFERPAWVTGW